MQRLIAVRNPFGTYYCGVVTYSNHRTKRVLEERYPTLYAAQMMISGGDLISIDVGPLRARNRHCCEREHTLPQIMERAAAGNIHHLSFYDKGDALMEEVGMWEMTCPAGQSIFVENIANAAGWYHIIDAQIICEQMLLPKAA